MGISRATLFTKTKALTNFTPKVSIQEIRLKHASNLLEIGKLSITKVDYKVGFKKAEIFQTMY
ncbi:helix-turn-helix domain-containing protein [Maribacter sp. TH_r10]|uniref:Helix-turn-helix domain-containing protein n=1 Tax=Maribacter luteus TaxID=2594478 RepID=A0A6I2MQL3_9FLAO|nr:helix-turn-helix domain-containing protein [Maribacter luteus]